MSNTNDREPEHGEAPVPRLLRIGQLAELLGVSVRYLRRLVQERRIPFIKMGHYVVFEPSQIVAWLEECRRPVQERRRSA